MVDLDRIRKQSIALAGRRSRHVPRPSFLKRERFRAAHAHKVTQKRMAEVLGIGQDSVARPEQLTSSDFDVAPTTPWAAGPSPIAEFPNQDPVVLAGHAAIESAKTDS